MSQFDKSNCGPRQFSHILMYVRQGLDKIV